MSVGLLIITHEGIGGAILRTAVHTLRTCQLHAAVLEVAQDNQLDEHRERAQQMLKEVDNGMGVLALTDLFGATPGNIAGELHNGIDVITVTGINLPMMLRVMNYSNLPLHELAEKAVDGARRCIYVCEKEET